MGSKLGAPQSVRMEWVRMKEAQMQNDLMTRWFAQLWPFNAVKICPIALSICQKGSKICQKGSNICQKGSKICQKGTKA